MSDPRPTSSTSRIILVEDVELEAKLAVRALSDHGFSDVVHARNGEAALQALDDKVPCVVVTDLNLMNGRGGIELVRQIRTRGGAPYVFTIVLTGQGNPVVLREAFDSGADDFMSKPFRPEELVARVRVGERIVRLERTLLARAQELEHALRLIDATAASAALARAAARERSAPANGAEALIQVLPWEALRDSLRSSISTFIGVEIESTTTGDTSAAVVGEVFMAETTKQLELSVSVVVGGASMRKLAGIMLGDETDIEAGCALVLETANVLMGALKTDYGKHGYAFVGGLPTSPTLADARTSYDAFPVRQRFAFKADGVELEVWVRASEKKNSKVQGSSLREGMVVAEDIRDDRGMLLVRGGVRLTQMTAERLAKLVPKIEVVVSST